MDNSTVILSLLSDKYVKKVDSNVMQQNKRESINYTNEMHNTLTLIAFSMVANIVVNTHRYKCIRISVDK